MTPDLSRLLRPRSVAIFGGGWAANVVEQLLKAGFDGDIWPIHPTRAQVHGVTAYPSLDALPHAPDAAWIGVNRDATVDIVRTLSATGAGGAVCFASGFGETEDGAERNAALLAAAGIMPIIGPNCYGLLNYLDGATLWPDQHGATRTETGVAILTQSSNIAINLTMQRRGLPIAYAMTAGNQAQIGLAAMATALLEDPRVTAIGLHVEGVGDPAAFEALAAAARARRIPVIALKVGRSEKAQAAAISHTASLAGSQAGSEAFFRHIGIPLVDDLPTFIETLKLLHVHGIIPPREGGTPGILDILSMSCSGGEASIMADAAEGLPIRYPDFPPHNKQAIAESLNPFVTIANPLDYHTFIWDDRPAMTTTFARSMESGFDLSILVLDFPRNDRCDDSQWDDAVDAMADAATQTGGRAAILATIPELLPEEQAVALIARGIVPFCGVREAMGAMSAAAQLQTVRQPIPHDAPKRPAIPTQTLTGSDEATLRAALAAYGLIFPEGRMAYDEEQAVEIAAAFGDPLVLKAIGIAHKSEQGGVAIGLRDEPAIRLAARHMLTLGSGIYIERMVENGLAEIILGITRDPVYGPMLTIGAGGVYTEMLRDTATIRLPCTEADIDTALRGLRIDALLSGFRGKPPADRPALHAAAMALASFALAHDAVQEVEINPLIICETGAWAADILIST